MNTPDAPIIEAAAAITVAAISTYGVVKVSQLKTHINSRMDELLALTKTAAFAAGKVEGAAEKKAEIKADAVEAAAAPASPAKPAEFGSPVWPPDLDPPHA